MHELDKPPTRYSLERWMQWPQQRILVRGDYASIQRCLMVDLEGLWFRRSIKDR